MSKGPLTQERLILCESGADAGLLRALISARGLPAFDVRPSYNPKKPDADGSGNTFFGETIVSLAVALSTAPTRHIVIVTDADDTPADTFQLVAGQIQRAKALEPSLGGSSRSECAVRYFGRKPDAFRVFCARAGQDGKLGVYGL